MLWSWKSPISLCPSLESPSSILLILELTISCILLDPVAASDHLELRHTPQTELAELPFPGASELYPSKLRVTNFPPSQPGATELLLS